MPAPESCARDDILIVGEERLGPPEESFRTQLKGITDLARLKRMLRRYHGRLSEQRK